MVELIYKHIQKISITLLAGLVLGFYFMPRGDLYYTLMRSEIGIVENLTVLFCLLGSYLSIRCMSISKNLPMPLAFKTYFFIFALGLFVLAGEEASWGQHYFGWEATGYLAEHNTQSETNFHNLGNHYEQIPKILLHLAALFTLVWSFYLTLSKKKLNREKIWYWVMPTSLGVMPALIALAVRLWERAYAWLKIEDWDASGPYIGAFKELKEANETFLILFVVAYLVAILYKANQQAK